LKLTHKKELNKLKSFIEERKWLLLIAMNISKRAMHQEKEDFFFISFIIWNLEFKKKKRVLMVPWATE